MYAEIKRDGETPSIEDQVSLPSVIAWLEEKPADGIYDFESLTNCAICQFAREALGCPHPVAGSMNFRPDRNGERVWFPFNIEFVVKTQPWTYGAALARARMLSAHKGG